MNSNNEKMQEKKIEVVKQGLVTTEISKGKTKGFIRKFEESVDFFEYFENIHHFDESPKISEEYCIFCHSGITSARVDLVRKTFRCSVCGLQGGLVLYVMLRDKCSLTAALRHIADYSYSNDVTLIPHHVLIQQR